MTNISPSFAKQISLLILVGYNFKKALTWAFGLKANRFEKWNIHRGTNTFVIYYRYIILIYYRCRNNVDKRTIYCTHSYIRQVWTMPQSWCWIIQGPEQKICGPISIIWPSFNKTIGTNCIERDHICPKCNCKKINIEAFAFI